jgi:hypothetical protein
MKIQLLDFPKFREQTAGNIFPRANIREQIFRPGFREGQREILDLVPENGNGKIMVFSTDTWVHRIRAGIGLV